MKSNDGGATWTGIGVATLPSFANVWSLVIDPANPDTIYAGETSKGVYKSVDGGATWVASSTGFTTGAIIQILALAIDPTNAQTLYAVANTSTGGGLYKSTNGGASWTQAFSDNSSVIGVQAVAVDPSNSANLYLGTFSQGVKKSVNGGASFAAATTGLPKVGVNALAVNPASPATVFAGTQDGVFASVNAAGSWAAASHGLSLVTVTAVAADPSTPTTVYAATKYSGLWKTVDGGDSWQAINGGIGTTGNLACNVPWYTSLAIDLTSPSTLYAGSQCTLDAQVYKSTNGGANWTATATGIPSFLAVSSLAVDPLAPATVYAGLATSGLYRSIDGGAHWSTVAAVATSMRVNAVSAGAFGNGMSTVAIATHGDGVLASTDGAATFEPFSNASAPLAGDRGPMPKRSILQGDCDEGEEATMTFVRKPNGQWGIVLGCEKPPNPGLGDVSFGWIMFLSPQGKTKAGSAALAGTLTPWAALAGGAEAIAACAPATSVVADPADSGASFYVGAGCGVLRGTTDGQQLVTMSTGMPAGMRVNALATTLSGGDVYAGAASGGMWRYTPSAAPPAPVTIIEYYNASLDHYFITWVPAEQANLDAGNTPTRWTRTGESFMAYTSAPAGTSPVCRYYIPPNLGDSHFFGRGTAECVATGQKNPTFTDESDDFMQMFLPAAGVCPTNTTNVYRVFSNRKDANHRYMTSKTIRDEMAAKGWVVEGDGPDAVVMCAPM